jgi:hypothetical protein
MNTSSYKNRGFEFMTVYEGMGKGNPFGDAILFT